MTRTVCHRETSLPARPIPTGHRITGFLKKPGLELILILLAIEKIEPFLSCLLKHVGLASWVFLFHHNYMYRNRDQKLKSRKDCILIHAAYFRYLIDPPPPQIKPSQFYHVGLVSWVILFHHNYRNRDQKLKSGKDCVVIPAAYFRSLIDPPPHRTKTLLNSY